MRATLFILFAACLALATAGCGQKDAPAERPRSAADVEAENDAVEPVEEAQKIDSAEPQPDEPKEPSVQREQAPIEAIEARITDKKIVISGKVMFEYNRAVIKSASHGLLNGVAKALKKHPEIIKIRIEGHTDSDGNAKYNRQLSKKRAKSVMEYLVKAGINENRMSASGYGEEMPIASNDSDEGKEKNRRVEFTIIERAKPVGATWTSSTMKPGVIESRQATDDETEAAVLEKAGE